MTEIPIAAPPPVQPAQSARSAPPAAPPSRSVFVTASGVVVAILPSVLIATALVMMPDTAPVRSLFARGDVGGIIGTTVFVDVLGLVMLAGIAIANRWRGWRYYAGTLGWLFVVLACFFVNNYFESLDFEPFVASASKPPTDDRGRCRLWTARDLPPRCQARRAAPEDGPPHDRHRRRRYRVRLRYVGRRRGCHDLCVRSRHRGGAVSGCLLTFRCRRRPNMSPVVRTSKGLAARQPLRVGALATSRSVRLHLFHSGDTDEERNRQ